MAKIDPEKKRALKTKAKEHPLTERLQAGEHSLIDIFLMNYFKESADQQTYDDLKNLIAENIPGRILFKNLLTAGAVWTIAGVEDISKSQSITRKFFKKFQTATSYTLDKHVAGFYSHHHSLFTSVTKTQFDVQTLVHELTHALCNIIYSNNSEPFNKDDDAHKQIWLDYIKSLKADLDKYMQVMQKKVSSNNATTQEKSEYDLYQSLLGFNDKRYSKSQQTKEAVSYLVEAIIISDLDDIKRLSTKTKELAKKLVSRLSNDCITWAEKNYIDAGVELIQHPLLKDNKQPSMLKNQHLLTTGIVHYTETSAKLLDYCIKTNIAISDVWFCMLDESIDKLKPKNVKDAFYSAFKDVFLRNYISLNGLHETIIRYFFSKQFKRIESEPQYYQFALDGLFECINEFTKDEPKSFGLNTDTNKLKFNPTRGLFYAIKYNAFNACFSNYQFSHEIYYDIFYWYGASGSKDVFQFLNDTTDKWNKQNIEKQEIEYYLELYIKCILKGAFHFGKTKLIEEIIRRYGNKISKLISINENAELYITLIKHGHIKTIQSLLTLLPEYTDDLIFAYLAAAQQKGANLKTIHQLFSNKKIREELLINICNKLIHKEMDKELDNLLQHANSIDPHFFTQPGYSNKQPIHLAIEKNNLYAFKKLLSHPWQRDWKNQQIRENILHFIAEKGNLECCKIFRETFPIEFNQQAKQVNKFGQVPFQIAIDNGKFGMAAVIYPDSFAKLTERKCEAKSATLTNLYDMLCEYIQSETADETQFSHMLQKLQHSASNNIPLEFSNNTTNLLNLCIEKGYNYASKLLTKYWPYLISMSKETAFETALKHDRRTIIIDLLNTTYDKADKKQCVELLYLSLTHDNPTAVYYLLKKQPVLLTTALADSYQGMPEPTLAMVALMNNSHKVLKWLSDNAIDISTTQVSTLIAKSNTRPLHLIAAQADTSKAAENSLQACLKYGDIKQLNQSDESGNFPIHYAAIHCHEALSVFYHHFPDLSVVNNAKNSPLHLALFNGKTTSARFILEKYPDCIYQTNTSGLRPIHIAAMRGNAFCKDIAAKDSKELSQPTKEGKTPLMLAIEGGHETAAMFLLENGACTNSKTFSTNDVIKMAKQRAMHGLAKAIFNRDLQQKVEKPQLTPSKK